MMQKIVCAATLFAALPISTAAAQQGRVFTFEPGRVEVLRGAMLDRPMLGVTLADGSEQADTLGVRVGAVRDDSPASKAGIKEGDRLQAINGVSLRADPADAGEPDYDGVLLRRLQREMSRVEEGDTVTLHVLSDGRVRELRVAAVSAEELYGSMVASTLRGVDTDRAVIGLTTSPVGNARDTLGVFVSSVNDSGPAAKAGIVEGDRIAAINGVSLRVAREDAGDAQVSQAKAERLRRELAKVTAGTMVEITVVSAGRSRTLRVTTVKASEVQMAAPTLWMPTMPTPLARPMAPAAPRVRRMVRDVRVL